MQQFIKKYKNLLIFLAVFILYATLIGKSLNPFSNQMFEFHDSTQGVRIEEFTLSLKELHIPPRLAPHFSYNLGFPVFNFYAPFSYWITSFLNLSGLSIINSIKVSFLLALIFSFIFSFLFLKRFFSFFSALFGSIIYSTSLYLALDIFVRGNLAETWFIALLPSLFFALYINSQQNTKYTFLFSTLILTAILSTHNILSLIALPLLLIYISLLKNKRTNLLSLLFGLVLNSYYFLPLIFESSLTYAKEIAQRTDYNLHFVCPSQLWDSLWGYGGSVEGCIDGISFKLGKIHTIFAFLGSVLFLWHLFKTKNKKGFKIPLFFFLLMTDSLFLTTFFSGPLWNTLSFALSIVQFPWRFISFSIIGLAFFSAYFWEKVQLPFRNIVIIFLTFMTILINMKYFGRPTISVEEYDNKYLSKGYLQTKVAYLIPEYLPRTADYNSWLSLKESIGHVIYEIHFIATNSTKLKINAANPFYRSATITANSTISPNIHYFPFWKIYIDGQSYFPKNFDNQGRPRIDLDPNKTTEVAVIYEQTFIEKIGNILSVLSFIFLIVIYKNWNLIKLISHKKAQETL